LDVASSCGAAKDRAASQVVVEHAPSKTEAQAREIIKTGLRTGILLAEEYRDNTSRKMRKGLKVNDAKRPGRLQS
jgi:hypothetical protein